METNKEGVATLISDKRDFRSKALTRDKEDHYNMTKEFIKRLAIVNIYAPNIRSPKCIKQIKHI